jgi:serine/threonine-protein kinase
VKACPSCYRIYAEEDGFCPVDGQKLAPYAQVGAQPGTDDPIVGSTIVDRYEVRRVVADGGMGRVYEARDNKGDRRVAVKVLHPEVARDPIAVERFRREFEISASLPHDHIVEVLDFQEAAQSFVMVMEFLDGEELRTVLKRDKTITPARLVRMMAQVAIGLDEAHRRQFVHRDLKPDNLFLCGSRDGDVVKILDFGSVRINKNRQMSKLTSMGTTIGSPFYMSPEQAQGAENLDNRADVFALGAIAYECLAGQVPFSGANGPAILLAILTKNPPPISTKVPSTLKLPAALDDVIDDALAKKPETRTQSVGALADSIGKAFALEGTHADWAKWATTKIEQDIEEARAAGKFAAASVVADPFAAAAAVADVDPFAQPPPPPRPPGAPSVIITEPPPPMPGAQVPAPQNPNAGAAMAMDQAFAAVGTAEMENAGVPQRSTTMIFIIAGIAVVALVLVLVLVLR